MIRFENVGLRYGVGPEILRDLTFEMLPRSFQFLTGPSGAGKTTLIRLIFLSMKPTRGLITCSTGTCRLSTKSDLPAVRRRIGVVFQDFRLLDHLTTFENVALPLRVLNKEELSYRTDVVELLRWVGLGDRMHAFPAGPLGRREAARGHRPRLIGKPEILLADEPTGNVDPPLARPPDAPLRRAQPARHVGGHRHPRL